jgi:uncharacterized protein
MSVAYTYPGIYIQELASSSNSVQPAPTSIAAFVGYSHPFQTAAFSVAQQIFSFNDYETYFGPLFSSGLVDASLPRAVYQFFLNGGSSAWVVGLQPGLFDNTGAIIGRLGPGGLNISASTGGGQSAAAEVSINPATALPTITSLSPGSITASTAFTLTITGTNFATGATVTWNGASAAVSAGATATQLQVSVPKAKVTAGPASVVVVNPAPGGSSAPATFTVNAADPAPTIASLWPAGAPAGSGDVVVTITGSGFVPSSIVGFNGTPLAANGYVSDTVLAPTIPAASLAAAGGFPIVVSNAAPGGDSPPANFTVGAANPVPSVSSLSPASNTAGGADFTLTVNGANFAPGAAINWNGAALATTLVNPNQLTATVPAANIVSAGAVNVAVVNTAPGGTSPAITFTVNASNLAPVITSVSPAGVPAGGGDFTLTIQGSNFVPTSSVIWDGAALATVEYVSDTQLQATVPAASIANPGSAYVAVSNPEGAGLVFTALELTDAVKMTVTITNVRNGGATFDVVISYGVRLETYRAVQLSGPAAQSPAGMINGVSKLVTVAPAAGGYGATIAAQQISLSFNFPLNLSTCFSADDFTQGQAPSIGVFDPNSTLDNVEIFNLLLVPGVTDFSVVSAALSFAERKRAFFIVDPPPQAPAFGSSIAAPQPIQYWMDGLNGPTGPSLPESENGALYFPYLVSADPVTSTNIPMAPSGFVAGIFAETDSNRGVWKAPAGLATNINNTIGPVNSGAMNDQQQGVLNQASINCLRAFTGDGTVVWGSRTLVAANPAYQQWKYVPVRRMTLFIEQSLLASMRWVVFEPNDEPLWIAIRTEISAFLLSLFRQGALQGDTPNDAFQVKCDQTTTTSDDQANGVVNIVVAFAPLKPAEFVVIKIAQLAGQTAGS